MRNHRLQRAGLAVILFELINPLRRSWQISVDPFAAGKSIIQGEYR
jgi:hypothetical protein